MSRFVIIVTFDLVAGALARFVDLIEANARQSIASEEGCEIFDVLVPGDSPDRVVLYERYRDRESFDVHCRTPHFLAFDRASAALVKSKSFAEFKPLATPSKT